MLREKGRPVAHPSTLSVRIGAPSPSPSMLSHPPSTAPRFGFPPAGLQPSLMMPAAGFPNVGRSGGAPAGTSPSTIDGDRGVKRQRAGQAPVSLVAPVPELPAQAVDRLTTPLCGDGGQGVPLLPLGLPGGADLPPCYAPAPHQVAGVAQGGGFAHTPLVVSGAAPVGPSALSREQEREERRQSHARVEADMRASQASVRSILAARPTWSAKEPRTGAS